MDELPKTYVDGKWVTLTRAHVDKLIEEGEKVAQVEPQAQGTYGRRLTRKERRRFENHHRGEGRVAAVLKFFLRGCAWVIECIVAFVLLFASC